ncbi:MAG: tRNA uridine-5-carboxymethylaminomethyl(34) synthesis GTPase MnmE [Deltaproteobacteria bacterium]|nr:tRNA uridine-5-carboxymethylaminomethyl(34) synthesis GTPase MnmE [Deltaproteobacteria bacterium]
MKKRLPLVDFLLLDSSETIVAPATPPGQGGIGIVRISGPQARAVGQILFRPAKTRRIKARQLTYGWIVEPGDQEIVDEVLAVFMPAPHTYTGQDVFEIQAHGGPVVMGRLIELCQEQGARLAMPGEFTLRAFLAGRIDLAQAEAVAELVGARTRTAARLAAAQLAGALSQPCQAVIKAAVEILAEVEAGIDFPEEDLGLAATSSLAPKLEAEVITPLDRLIKAAEMGRSLREGARVVLIGRPNVGKSSLLNALRARPRALVTDVPGTTRDYLEEALDLGGLPVVLTDTAGLGQESAQAPTTPEEAGKAASRQMMDQADLLLLVVDAAEGFTSADKALIPKDNQAHLLVVANKADLVLASQAAEALVAGGPEPRELICRPTARQREALERARQAFLAAGQGLDQGRAVELVAVEMKEGLDLLGRVAGQTAPEEVLHQIFSRFCLGK